MSNCRIEALVTIDGRGQMVIPKEVRETTDIHAGEKLVVFTRQKEGEVCYIFLVRAEDFAATIENSFKRIVDETASK
ncbi:MAG: AbrB/MazE/SpoVT family DNA-binding domain-containing protein [Chloroflexi bacterium]|nr:AbrB/MazE/SpoVT family DNA-binding domain-containing protein [Chloroflexota bacterium]